MDEAHLILRCQRRDLEAFRKLYERYKDFVYNLSFQFFRSREEAEDITQEVFVRLFFKISRYRFQAPFKTYVAKMTLNLCRDVWRKNARGRARPDIHQTAAPSAEREEIVALREALAKLPPLYREVLILKEMEQFSIAEVAEATGKREGTVKSLLHRGKKQLKELLEHG